MVTGAMEVNRLFLKRKILVHILFGQHTKSTIVTHKSARDTV